MMRPRVFEGLTPALELRLANVAEDYTDTTTPPVPTAEDAIKNFLSSLTTGAPETADVDLESMEPIHRIDSDIDAERGWLGFRATQTLVESNVAASLGLAFARMSVESRGLILLYDAYFFQTTARYYVNNEQLFRVVDGVGVRIEILVSEIKADFALNIASVAAAAEARLATSSYRIYGLGISNLDFGIGLPTEGGLTSSSLLSLAKSVKSGLKNIAENLKEVQTEPIEEYLGSEATSQPDTEAQSVLFAMKSINTGRTMDSALAMADGFQGRVIEAVYGYIAHSLDRYQPPSEEAKKRAAEWINSSSE